MRGSVALVCWDQWFPEAARLTALAGAQILFYPTAIGWQFDEGEAVDAAQHDAWETVQRGHAIANGVFVAAVNRVGVEGNVRFWGGSFVSDPFGRVLGPRQLGSPRRRCSSTATSARSSACGAIGPSCATGASTPTATWKSGWSIDVASRRSRRAARRSRAKIEQDGRAKSWVRWPAEWEPHGATWLAWPHNPDTWPGHLEDARREFVEIVRALAGTRAVELLVADAAMEGAVRARLAAAGVDPDDAGSALPRRADERRLAARLRLRSSSRPRAAGGSRSTSATTPGAASTRPGTSTRPSARASRSSRGSSAARRASCSRAARSTATGRARS